MYKVNGSKPHHDPKTGEVVSLWQLLKNTKESGVLRRALIVPEEAPKVMSPKSVAATAKNEAKMKGVLEKLSNQNLNTALVKMNNKKISNGNIKNKGNKNIKN